MLRFDNRSYERTPNALLYSKQKFYWYIVAEAVQKQPPQDVFNVEIHINSKEKQFILDVNGEKYKFMKDNTEVNLFSEFKQDTRIGWFNEEGPVKLSNIDIC